MSKQADKSRRLRQGEVRLRLHVEKDLFDCMVQPTPRLATPKKPDAWLTPVQLGMWSAFTGTQVSGRASKQSVRMRDEVAVRDKVLELWPTAEVHTDVVKDGVWVIEVIRRICGGNASYPAGMLVCDHTGAAVGKLTGTVSVCRLEGCTGVRLSIRGLVSGKVRYRCSKHFKFEGSGLERRLVATHEFFALK